MRPHPSSVALLSVLAPSITAQDTATQRAAPTPLATERRKNLALGVQFVSWRFAVHPDVEVSWSTIVSTVGLRYYW